MSKTDNNPIFDPATVPEEYREQMVGMVPKASALEAYTPRDVVGGFTDFEVFEAARSLRHNVMLVGPTGAGKTTAARAFAAHLGVPFVSVEFNGAMDTNAILGGTTVDTETGLPVWKHGEVTLGVKYGPAVVMLDEVNFAPPRFTAAFHGVLDARQTLYLTDLGVRVPKHEGTLIIGAYNNRYRGTNLLNEAFQNRWAFTFEWGYDEQVEAERIGEYSATLLRRVREMRADPDIQGDIGTNAMEEFIHIAHALNIEAAILMFLGKLDPEDRSIAERVFEAEKLVIADELGCDTEED